MSKDRQIRVIMFTDIIGFSDIMSNDVSEGIKVLEINSDLHNKGILKYSGKLVKKIGDGTLCIFDSVVEAVNSGQELIKEVNKTRLYKIRIGIHIGELIFKDNDIFGEGVNIASRLESIAKPDSIIISKDVNDQLLNYKHINSNSLGSHSIKGVNREIELFSISSSEIISTKKLSTKKIIIEDGNKKNNKSILVLPFLNKGKDEDNFFCYGISSELISELSFKSELLVNSIDNYKIKNWQELSFLELSHLCSNTCVLSGTFWKREDVFQLSIELFDLKNQNIIWADHWHDKWDTFSSIPTKIVKSIYDILGIEETTNIKTCKTISSITEAYDLYLEAKYIFQHRHDEKDIIIAKDKLSNAIKLDRDLLQAYMLNAEILICEGKFFKSLNAYKKLLYEYIENNDKIRIASCLNSIGDILFFIGKPNIAISLQNKALSICESSNNIRGIGYVLNSIGNIHAFNNDFDRAEKSLLDSLKIRELLQDKMNIAATLGNLSLVKLNNLDFNEANSLALKSLELRELCDDSYGLGIIHNILGNIEYQRKNNDDAKFHYNKSIEYKNKINDNVGKVVTLNNLSNIYFNDNKIEKAIDELNNSLEISQSIGYYLGTCQAKENLANIYSHLNKIEKSKQLIEESLEIRYKVGFDSEINKTKNKYKSIDKGNKDNDLEFKSSPVHNNLFPSKDINISNTKHDKNIDFNSINSIVGDINDFIKNLVK